MLQIAVTLNSLNITIACNYLLPVALLNITMLPEELPLCSDKPECHISVKKQQ
jgi:hypothetical protein